MESVGLSRKHWVTKFESGFCGAGWMMKIRKQKVMDNYSRYGAENDTTTHIFMCPAASAYKSWEILFVIL